MEDLPQYLNETTVDIGIIAIPKQYAQKLADELVSMGVRAIWNFAPVDVDARRGISVENVHLSDSLYILSYRMRENIENN